MVPLGKLLIDQVSQPMQVLGAKMAGISAQMLGMPRIEWRVAGDAWLHLRGRGGLLRLVRHRDARAGGVVAYLVKAPLWKRLVIFASSLPVAILANAVRIWLTVMLGTALGHEAAEGFFHTASGMIVFVLAFLGLFGVTVLLKCRRLRDDI